MQAPHESLNQLVTAIFSAAGCNDQEAACVSDHLVEANLAGHDSHGVIRVRFYIEWLRDEKVLANRQLQVVSENEVLVVVDGQLGFGQVMGRQAMQLGLQKCEQFGVAVVALRNSGHLGRIGHWAEMAVEAGYISLHFVNTNGLGVLVAPFGGIERRVSANPVAVGIPVKGGPPIIFDISTSAVAEGKIKVALNRGVDLPDGCLIDAAGQPTNDPKVFYGTPPGAILPFGGHKGYGLGIVADLLAGALTGSGCSGPGKTRLEQGMLAIILDPKRFGDEEQLFPEIRRFIDFVKSSKQVSPDSEILMPGQIEAQTRARRAEEGIPLDETTWNQIVEVARSLGVSADLVDAVANERPEC